MHIQRDKPTNLMPVLFWVVGSLMMWNAFIAQWMKIYEMPLMENSIFSRQWDLFYHEKCDRRTNYLERWWISFPRMCLCEGYVAICWGCFNLDFCSEQPVGFSGWNDLLPILWFHRCNWIFLNISTWPI